MLKKEMDKIRAEQEVLLNIKKGIGKEMQEAEEQCIDADYVERFCNSISTVLYNLSFEDKRSVLREVIDKIVVKDGEISIYGVIPKCENESCETELMLFDSRSS